jgi:hypothetical protein
VSGPPEPPRIARLHRDKHHRPVPWFVAWTTGPPHWHEREPGKGTPDFRILRSGAPGIAWAARICWVCGTMFQRQEPRAFVIGPMCAINRISAEPPSHYECAQFSALACPFLTVPNMVRRDKHLPPDADKPAGIMIMRNPGVTLVWVAKYNQPSTERDPAGGILFNIGQVPLFVEWYAEGRAATRAEVLASIESGLPALREPCEGSAAALAALDEAHRIALRLVPA